MQDISAYLRANLVDSPYVWGTLFGWAFVHAPGKLVSETQFPQQSRTWIDEWLLPRIFNAALQQLGLDSATAQQAVTLLKILTAHQRWFVVEPGQKIQPKQVLEVLLRDGDVQQFLKVNRFQNVLWFNKEAYDELLVWLFVLAVIHVCVGARHLTAGRREELLGYYQTIVSLQEIGQASGYQVERLLAAANNGEEVPDATRSPVRQ